MSEEVTFGLSDLVVVDDLNVSMNNDEYQDQANPAPVAAGIYSAKITKFDAARDKDKKPVFEGGDQRFPTLQIVSVEIVEGLGDGVSRKVGLFHNIKTKPYDRFGTPVSGLGDLTRAYGTENWAGIPAGIALVKEAVEGQQVFAAQYDWSIFDKDFIEAAKEQLGLTNSTRESRAEDENEKKLYNAMYRAASVNGMRFFPFNADKGTFSHVFQRDNVQFKNPVSGQLVTIEGSHRTIEARSSITRFYPKADVDGGRVKLGPSKTKPTPIKVG